MNYLSNQELDDINKQRHTLIYLYESKKLTDEEYYPKIKELNDKKAEIIRDYLNKNEIKTTSIPKEEGVVKEELEEEKMAKEEKVEKPLNEMSNAQLILKALQMKSVKTYDDVAVKVKEWKPIAEATKIKAMAKVMTKEITLGKGGKAKKYTWDEATFNLVKKEE